MAVPVRARAVSGTAVLFVIDLVRGGDVFRAILGNAVGAVVLIGWAALDTVRDPESTVTSVGGATGTALLLYALYLAGTGAIIAATALLGHDYFTVGLLYAVLAAVAAGQDIVSSRQELSPTARRVRQRDPPRSRRRRRFRR
ncbi:hypothetical protein [Halovenus salina]|uniref:Uncharacterized protein n=1 Tax=Halovenus salina TaxID=1510225 RepID=A0ABD5W1L1_9EURY